MGLSPQLEHFEAFSVRDLANRPSPEWLVERLIPAKSITLLMGASQARKSFTVLELAACIASGRPFLGRNVKMGTVLYLSLEDSFDISSRFQAITADFDDKTAQRFIASESAVTLPKRRLSFEDLQKFLRARVISPNAVSTIIFDTYAYFNDGDLNSPSDASAILRELRGLILEFNVSIILVCHPALDNENRPMGAMNLFNSVACVLKVKQAGINRSSITTLKNKGGPIGGRLVIEFGVVDLADGSTTLRLKGLVGETAPGEADSPATLSQDDEKFLQLLEQAGTQGFPTGPTPLIGASVPRGAETFRDAPRESVRHGDRGCVRWREHPISRLD